MSWESSTKTEQLSVWGTKAGLVDRKLSEAPRTSYFIDGRPNEALLFGSLVDLEGLDMVCGYWLFFLLDI